MKQSVTNFPENMAAARIRSLAAMSDVAFADEFLSDLSPDELREFLDACPEFPVEALPERLRSLL